MNSIRVLDCTLRDGGCVNNFCFGQDYMDRIKLGLEESGVDIIELGYIDGAKGAEAGRTQFISDAAIRSSFLKHKKPGVKYVAMIDYGTCSIDRISGSGKDMIFSFLFSSSVSHTHFSKS